MNLDQSGGPESVQVAIDNGRLDDALRELTKSATTSDAARTLAYLLCQRGDYGRAVEVLRDERWSGTLGVGGLRLRGNSLWRAGRLNEALRDLEAAERSAVGQTDAAAIRSDIVLLQEEGRVMSRVDQSLTKLDFTFATAIGLIAVALVEVHRRAIARSNSRF